MTDSIFTKIINSEIPTHKIYEDEKTIAILDIEPKAPGHVLVIPKIQVDKVYDLDDEHYSALWNTAKKVASHMDKILNKRIFIKVIGTDVPHAHIHLIPQDENYKSGQTHSATEQELKTTQEKLNML